MNELTDAERELLLCDCHLTVAIYCPVHNDSMDLWTEKAAGEIEAAVEQIITARLDDHKARAVAAIEAEFLLDATGGAEDIAYDLAIKHAVRAVRAVRDLTLED